MTTRIFVTVGTDHHPFPRLIDWVDDWVEQHADIDLVVQHGSSPPSRLGQNHELLSMEQLESEYEAADLVVSQVGPGTISDANRAGHRPVVVPRDSSLGEVVDDHQIDFGVFMQERGRCVTARSRDELHQAMDIAASTPADADDLELSDPGTTAAVMDVLARRVVRLPSRRLSGRRALSMIRPARTD